jgi:hypothetical protein
MVQITRENGNLVGLAVAVSVLKELNAVVLGPGVMRFDFMRVGFNDEDPVLAIGRDTMGVTISGSDAKSVI